MLTISRREQPAGDRWIRSNCWAIAFSIFLGAGSTRSAAELAWKWGPVLPIDKTCRATAAVGQSVVTVGGTRWEPRAEGAKVKQWLSAAWALDLNRMKWRSLPDYPVPAGYAFAAGINGRI